MFIHLFHHLFHVVKCDSVGALQNKAQLIPHLDTACMRRREQRYEPQKTPGSTSFPAVKVAQNR